MLQATVLCPILTSGACAAHPLGKQTTSARVSAPDWLTNAERVELERCYQSDERYSHLKINTLVLYFARGSHMLFVDVELPEAEALSECFEDVLQRSKAPVFGPKPGDDVFGAGGFLLQIGEAPLPSLSGDLTHHSQRSRRMAKEALDRGAILPTDPPAQELLDAP